ncbi:MAG TPA: hypothetical protein VHZ24_17385 [Pirellulales bacterium]|jgi:hypothetical protein|nr:hypothetical protein [Pirellulales bacterium]
MKQIGAWSIYLCAVCGPALAAELQPLVTKPTKVLLSEEFSGDAVPATFRTLGMPESFSITDGALQMVSRAGQERSTHGAFVTPVHNLSLAFSVKFVTPGTLYIGVDGYKEEFKGNTHLVRFALAPDHMTWDEKRGGPESKRAVGEAMKAARAAKQPIPQPTAEQLADPSFFRTEELAIKPIDCPVGQWHEVLLEVNGNDLVARVNGQQLVAKATVADSMKSRIGVGLTGRSMVLIDKVRIWESTRRAK